MKASSVSYKRSSRGSISDALQVRAFISVTTASRVSSSIEVSRNSCCGTGCAQSSPSISNTSAGVGAHPRAPARARTRTDSGRMRGSKARIASAMVVSRLADLAVRRAHHAGEAGNAEIHRRSPPVERHLVEILDGGEVGGVEQPREVAQHRLTQLLHASASAGRTALAPLRPVRGRSGGRAAKAAAARGWSDSAIASGGLAGSAEPDSAVSTSRRRSISAVSAASVASMRWPRPRNQLGPARATRCAATAPERVGRRPAEPG